MRKTKIIATLGPATESKEMLEKLVLAGANVFRLNMSHAQHDWVRAIVPRIRHVAAKLDLPVGILLDTQGPAIRTGDLPTKLDLNPGDIFTFTVRGHHSEEAHSVDTNYDDLVNDLKIGDVVLVDNGGIRMIVRDKKDKEIRCEVLTQATMGSRRHINLPGVRVNLPALTEKDLKDLEVGLEAGVDFVALSFVREASDLAQLREVLASHNASGVKIIAKIEDQSAVENIDSIIEASDAVMVARGDLGIECPYEELPIIQRKVVKKCILACKPVIVATHLLESMISNPMPTRAEITDVSNAVFEGADAIMLSGETSLGKYPVECVNVLATVATRTERSGNQGFHLTIPLGTNEQSVVSSAVDMANKVDAAGILLFSKSGRLPRMTAALRPQSSPIFAFTPTPGLANQLTLRFGIYSFPLAFLDNPEENLLRAEANLKRRSLVKPGENMVVITDVLSEGDRFMSIQLRKL